MVRFRNSTKSPLSGLVCARGCPGKYDELARTSAGAERGESFDSAPARLLSSDFMRSCSLAPSLAKRPEITRTTAGHPLLQGATGEMPREGHSFYEAKLRVRERPRMGAWPISAATSWNAITKTIDARP